MTPRTLLSALAMILSAGASIAQQAPAPLPSAPQATPLILPRSTGAIPPFSSTRNVAASDRKPPPPAPVEEAESCSAPTDTGWNSEPIKESERSPYQWYRQNHRWSSPSPIRENMEFEWSKYIAAYNRQTQQHMRLPIGIQYVKPNTKVQIRFSIQQDGSVTDAAVMMSSGKKNYDKAALDSVLKSSPYNPLPADVVAPVKFCVLTSFNPYFGDKAPTDDPFASKPQRQ